MTHHRKALRSVAKDLLTADPFFLGATEVLSSAQVDVAACPCFSVSTPSEDQRDLSRRQVQVDTDLVVAAKVTAAVTDIEDLLDDYSEKIETLLVAGLKEQLGVQSVSLARTETKTGPETKQILGSVMMLFVVTGFMKLV
jgi:hypothetical protein